MSLGGQITLPTEGVNDAVAAGNEMMDTGAAVLGNVAGAVTDIAAEGQAKADALQLQTQAQGDDLQRLVREKAEAFKAKARAMAAANAQTNAELNALASPDLQGTTAGLVSGVTHGITLNPLTLVNKAMKLKDTVGAKMDQQGQQFDAGKKLGAQQHLEQTQLEHSEEQQLLPVGGRRRRRSRRKSRKKRRKSRRKKIKSKRNKRMARKSRSRKRRGGQPECTLPSIATTSDEGKTWSCKTPERAKTIDGGKRRRRRKSRKKRKSHKKRKKNRKSRRKKRKSRR